MSTAGSTPAGITPVGVTSAQRVGAWMWGVQPLLVVVELAVAMLAAKPAVPLGALLRDHSISDLGADRRAWVSYSGVPVFSPAWMVMNAAFVVFGVLLAVGAVLLRRRLARGWLAAAVMLLWVVVGVSSAGAGLVPLGGNTAAHEALSAPALLAQPAAMLLLGSALPGRWRRPTIGVGVVSLIGAAIYLGRPGDAVGAGLFERMALWPAYLWLPVVALALLGDRRRHS